MKHTEQSAITMLVRNRIRVYPEDRQIYVQDMGIRLWGAVDYLVNHCKYRKVKSGKE